MRILERSIGVTAGLLLGLGSAMGFDANRPVPPAPIAGATPAPPTVNPRRDPVIPRPPASIPTPRVTAVPVQPAAPKADPISPAAMPVPPAAMPVPPRDAVPVPKDAMPVPPTNEMPGPSQPQTPWEAFRHGMLAERAGEKTKAITAYQYAAEHGYPAAQWKLGRMYADGDGVKQSDLRAFEYFSGIANAHFNRLKNPQVEDNPNTPQARFVANAVVALGHYYLEGIPDTPVKRDVRQARHLYTHAATYFGDPDGQYYLARLYLDGAPGIPKQPDTAALWLNSAATKGQHQAQAVLGHMLFKGEHVPRKAALGLMWLTLARSAAGPGEAWIAEMHDAAIKQATVEEREVAGRYLMQWMNRRRN